MLSATDRSRKERAPGSGAGAASVRHGDERLAYLDGLKLGLVAVIIAGHGAVAYGDLENAWPYQDVQEVRLGALSNAALSVAVILGALFTMGLFFLMSGLVTPGSLARKGPRRFARDRLVRLGAPLLAWTLVLWPAAIWLAHLAAGDPRSVWSRIVDGDPILDTGPMWFVEVLLAYSLVYAFWRSRARGRLRPPRLTLGRALVLLAVAISAGTVAARLVFPAGSNQIGQSHLWQWPQYVAMFGLGTVAARRGWLNPVPDRIRRRCGLATLGGVVAFCTLVLTMTVTGVDGDVLFERGLHWAPLSLAAIEGPLAVGASVWLLGVAQRRIHRPAGVVGRMLVRGAYAAFLLQGVVLIGLMIVLRPLDLPAELKALLVAALGVVACFAAAAVLVTRTPLRRIL